VSVRSRRGEGEKGNREVPPRLIRRAPGETRARRAAAYSKKEGGSWGKHGFPHATEPKSEEAA
jgi:hypothetical protein